jgi:hypothetical protein
MALTSAQFMTATGLNSTNLDKLDVSDVLAAILLKDTATLGQIKMEGTASNTRHYWIEDELNSATFQAMCSVSGSNEMFVDDVNLSTTAEVMKVFRTNALVMPEGYGAAIYKVIAPGSATITVSTYGSASASVWVELSTTQRFFVVGQPYRDIDDASSDVSVLRTRRSNVTQIFERAIEIAQTREHIDLYAINDELKHQIRMRTYEIKRELNIAVLLGKSSPATMDNTERRSMAGLIQLIRDYDLDGTNEDDNVSNASSGALTLTRINDLCKTMYDNGGFDDQSNCCIIVGPYQARVIALLEEGRIRKSSNELIVGSYANAVKTDLGFDLPVVIDRWCPSDTLIILDKPFAKLMPLQGDSWGLVKMAKTGRTQKYQLSGQYTVELRSSQARHGLIHNLAWS